MLSKREKSGNIRKSICEFGNELWTLFVRNFIGSVLNCLYFDWNSGKSYTRLDIRIKSKSGKLSRIMSLHVIPEGNAVTINGISRDLFAWLLSGIDNPNDIVLTCQFDQDNSRQYLTGTVLGKGKLKTDKGLFEVELSRKFNLPSGKDGEDYISLANIDNVSQELVKQVHVEAIQVNSLDDLFTKIGKKVEVAK